ncbi:hypothetical protein F5884DRAFT_258320 [Xylogone sp. PMI_703]|nr:hypothetical protein F5884DRAFT_258320 [Xylogone sp. PMI_703]
MPLSLFRRILPKAVANTASQLRDHQANERTYLSWTRMGLAFAAMSLALGRMDIIDRILNPHRPAGDIEYPQPGHRDREEKSMPSNNLDRAASRLCEGISIWSFGYGISRYLSVRRNLLQGRFVPAIWGPILMTCGTLGVFGMVIQIERRVPGASNSVDRVEQEQKIMDR